MKTRNILPFLFLLLLSYHTKAQASKINRLEIRKGEVYFVGPDNALIVDTLIMHDRSIIRFDPEKQGRLVAKVAIIGRRCEISAKGADGMLRNSFSPGEDGDDGGVLDLALSFESLGSLTIDVRGGNGGKGANGKNGYAGKPAKTEKRSYIDAKGKLQTTTVVELGDPGTDGTDATKGGSGGNGGKLTLKYSSPGFTPTFNRKGRREKSILILYAGGAKGKDGTPGSGGIGSKNGTLINSAIKASKDGQIEIRKVDSILEQ